MEFGGVYFFSYFCFKTYTVDCGYKCVPTIYVLSKNKKQYQYFSSEYFHSYNPKNLFVFQCSYDEDKINDPSLTRPLYLLKRYVYSSDGKAYENENNEMFVCYRTTIKLVRLLLSCTILHVPTYMCNVYTLYMYE